MKFLSSLFWRLYLSIIGTLAVVAVLFMTVTAYFEENSALDHFYADSRRAADPILQQAQQQKEIVPAVLDALSQQYLFDIEILNSIQIESITSGLLPLGKRADTSLYESQDGRFYTLEPLQWDDKWLVISETDLEEEFLDTDGELPFSVEQSIALYEAETDDQLLTLQIVIGLSLLMFAFVLVLQVRTISKSIEHLMTTSVAWGKGKLGVRADENASPPLDSLAVHLNEMAANLQQSNKEQQVIAHAISHELRTPLSKLELALTLLKKKQPELADEPMIESLASYLDELNTLTSTVLTYSKIRHGANSQNIGRIDFGQLVQDRCSKLKALYADKTVSYEKRECCYLTGDVFYLQVMLDNIISNALKYASNHIDIDVSQHAGEVYLTVSDDGPGIALNDREQVFLPFYRADKSRTRDTGGVGLGLAMVETVVHQFGGKILLSESSAGGLCLSVTLPAQ